MNKLIKMNEIEKVIRKRLKEELPNCKFAVHAMVNAFDTGIDVHLMSADFIAFNGNFAITPYFLITYCFFDEEPDHYYQPEYSYLTPDVFDAFWRVVKIVESLKLGDSVYLDFYLGEPDQPFELSEMGVNDI